MGKSTENEIEHESTGVHADCDVEIGLGGYRQYDPFSCGSEYYRNIGITAGDYMETCWRDARMQAWQMKVAVGVAQRPSAL